MTAQMAQRIIDNYVSSTLALRASSMTPAAEANENIGAYQAERLDVYMRWENAKFCLQELPTEYKAQAVTAIQELNGGQAYGA